MPDGGDLRHFDEERALSLVEDIIENKEQYVAKLTEKSKMLFQEAHQNEKYLARLLAKKKK